MAEGYGTPKAAPFLVARRAEEQCPSRLFEGELIAILHKLFPKLENKSVLPKSFKPSNSDSISRQRSQDNYRPISLITT